MKTAPPSMFAILPSNDELAIVTDLATILMAPPVWVTLLPSKFEFCILISSLNNCAAPPSGAELLMKEQLSISKLNISNGSFKLAVSAYPVDNAPP